jgi:uncharacterized protein involved in exopolysaccharide biosynthesis
VTPSEQISIGHDDEIDVIALCRVVWGYKYLLLLTSGLGGLVAVYLALTATPIYRAEVVVTAVHDGGMSAAASLANQLGGLASLAGVNLAAGGGADREAEAVLMSRHLVEEFIKSQGLLSELSPKSKKPPTLWSGVKRFREGVLTIREEKLTGLTTVAIDWTDPVTAARWANGFVALANELIRARALDDSRRNIAYLNGQIAHTNVVEVQTVMYSLIEAETKTLMLANARAEYAFTVVDPAVPPEIRISPRRTLMVMLGTAVGLFIGLIAVFLLRMFGRRPHVGSVPTE